MNQDVLEVVENIVLRTIPRKDFLKNIVLRNVPLVRNRHLQTALRAGVDVALASNELQILVTQVLLFGSLLQIGYPQKRGLCFGNRGHATGHGGQLRSYFVGSVSPFFGVHGVPDRLEFLAVRIVAQFVVAFGV